MNELKANIAFSRAENIYVCGDVNIDILKFGDHVHTNEYVSLLFEHSLLPAITIPSRISSNSSTCIDNISCRSTGEVRSGLLLSKMSDHLPTFLLAELKPKKEQSHASDKLERKMNSANVSTFENLLLQIDWPALFMDYNPESAFKFFFTQLNDCFERAFPSFKKMKKS